MDVRWMLPVVAIVGRAANILGAWLLTYAVHSTALLLAAWWLASRPRPRWSPAAQHTIWSVALVAGFVTSAAQVAAPWLPHGGSLRLAESPRHPMTSVEVTQRVQRRTTATSMPAAAGDVNTVGRRVASASVVVVPGTSGEASMRFMAVGVSRPAVAVALWALVAGVLLAHLALARRRLAASLRERTDVSHTMAGGALRHLLDAAGVMRGVALTVSDALRAPAAITGNEIVLPTRALRELTLYEQEGVLAHELAHVVRRDTGWLRLAMWIERVAWFQPLNRIARRRMQLSAEFAADGWAVRVTRQPLRLAQALAKVAEWVASGATSPSSFVPGADGSPLVERVRRLTSPTPPREGLGGRAGRAMMGFAAAVALAVLPRIDVGPTSGKLAQSFERIAMWDSNGKRLTIRETATNATHASRVPLVRVGGRELFRRPGNLIDSTTAISGAREILIAR